MLVRTVVTHSTPSRANLIRTHLLKLGLAQNVTFTNHIEGDWVDPELLGMSHKTYLLRVAKLREDVYVASGLPIRAHVEIS